MKTAFITGICGQDGYYLKKILKDKNYNIVGFDKVLYEKNDIQFHNCDLSNYEVVLHFFKKYKPNVIFNLAGVSDVFEPWRNVREIISSNIMIPQNFMDVIIQENTDTSFCQASSCLVYGNTKTKIQDELTVRDPIYPYGLSKNFIDSMILDYREKMGLNFCSAIFYNHDSPKRGDNFFIKKLIKVAKSLKNNPNQKIKFGNLNIKKDLGYAGDYMEAFFLMSQSQKKDDYIISSGKLTLLKDIVLKVSELSGINILDHIEMDSNQKSHENMSLFGNNSKIKIDLNWEPKKSYEEVVEMIWES